jgi:RNA-directed DNA polymerase
MKRENLTEGIPRSKGRRRTMEPKEGTMHKTQSLNDISTKLIRIAKQARENLEPLTTLAHHVDMAWMREAYLRTRKDGALGIDGQSAAAYAQDLEKNLQALLGRAKSGTYRAPAVRRVYIPKGKGEQRALGIPTFEDKVLQRAIAMVLEPVYETQFLNCSYGFRPGRSARQALDTLYSAASEMRGGWLIELDIRKYRGTIDHHQLQTIVRQRIGDGVILRLIGKWLNAGCMEGGVQSRSDVGTPQGGVISPLLANIYLHVVLNVWFEQEVRPCLRGGATLVRYADDAVMLFENEDDAKRVMQVLPKRFGRYGLTLHPDKTRLVPFQRPSRSSEPKGGPRDTPRSFDFLGFTHVWVKTHRGYWALLTRTAKDRFQRTLTAIAQWCKMHRHAKLDKQQIGLNAKLRGHYGYFDRRGNRSRLWGLLHCVTRIWRGWLSRRSQRAYTSWAKMTRILQRYPLLTPKQLLPNA